MPVTDYTLLIFVRSVGTYERLARRKVKRQICRFQQILLTLPVLTNYIGL